MRLAVALLGALLTAGCGGGEGPAVVDTGVPVVDADGIRRVLEERRGQPLLVNFWARWCSPCVAELPDLQAARAGLRAAGGDVLGFAMDLWAPGYELDEARRAIPGFLRERGIDFPVWVYGSKDPMPVLDALDIPGDLPVTIAVDRSGAFVGIHGGRATPEEFAELVRLAVGG